MLMKKPEYLASASMVCGVNTRGKEIVDVPEVLVSEFLKLGFKPVEELDGEISDDSIGEQEDKDKERSTSQAVRDTRESADTDGPAEQDFKLSSRRRRRIHR